MILWVFILLLFVTWVKHTGITNLAFSKTKLNLKWLTRLQAESSRWRRNSAAVRRSRLKSVLMEWMQKSTLHPNASVVFGLKWLEQNCQLLVQINFAMKQVKWNETPMIHGFMESILSNRNYLKLGTVKSAHSNPVMAEVRWNPRWHFILMAGRPMSAGLLFAKLAINK